MRSFRLGPGSFTYKLDIEFTDPDTGNWTEREFEAECHVSPGYAGHVNDHPENCYAGESDDIEWEVVFDSVTRRTYSPQEFEAFVRKHSEDPEFSLSSYNNDVFDAYYDHKYGDYESYCASLSEG